MMVKLICTIWLVAVVSANARFSCSCQSAPTGKGCGENSLAVCDANNCDGQCISFVGGVVSSSDPTSTSFTTSSLLEVVDNPTDDTSKDPTSDATSTDSFSASGEFGASSSSGSSNSSDAGDGRATDAGNMPQMSTGDGATGTDGLNPNLAPIQITTIQRAAALRNAVKNLVAAENEPLKHNGVRPSATRPSNIHITMIYANNNACNQQNISQCNWIEYPIMNYGGDLPMAPKVVGGMEKGIQFMVSCIVCGENKMCTRPEFNAAIVETKTLVDEDTKFDAGLAAGGVEKDHSRFTLLNVAHEISNIEKKCKRTSAPFDQRLNHLRNQHPGLEQMFGVPPPASTPTISMLQMLRAQRL
jgi:hypothetical protein